MTPETEICDRCKQPGATVFADCPTCGTVLLCADCAAHHRAELALEAGAW